MSDFQLDFRCDKPEHRPAFVCTLVVEPTDA
jgi:hypothetical protein